MKKNNRPEPAVTVELNSPVLSTLKATGTFVDNAFVQSLTQLRIVRQFLDHSKKKKQQGVPAESVLLVVLMTPLIAAQSTWNFCQQFLANLSVGKKDVIYRFIRNQSIRWAAIQRAAVKNFCRRNADKLGDAQDCALIVDDTLCPRTGRKVEGTSSLWDHTRERSLRCHQVLTLGLAFAKGFIPLASQICIGKKKTCHRTRGFDDKRSEVARSWRTGLKMGKNEILKQAVARAMRLGIKVKWLIGDAGFGTKNNIALALDHGLEALFLMKRNRTKYRLDGRQYTAKELYLLFRRLMAPVRGGAFRCYRFEAEINLTVKRGDPPRWERVQLMLSRPSHNRNAGGWVLCLCTDLEVDSERMIELYSMRWSIEVYFKECKQHLGHLAHQSGDYVSSYASIHLCALRYLILLDGALEVIDSGELGLAGFRKKQHERLSLLNYMGVLWEVFTALVCGLLDELAEKYGSDLMRSIREDITEKLREFIDLAFEIDLNGDENDPPTIAA